MISFWGGFVAVGVGAAIGAWLRWGLAAWVNPLIWKFPLGTLAANLIGGFLVGLGVAFFMRHPEVPPVWRLFAITGFLGGLTTFSTYSAEVVGLLERGEVPLGLALAAVHLLGSFALTALGFWTYRALAGNG